MVSRRGLVVALLLALSGPLPAQHLELRFFDVGQGSAVLIREGGYAVLVDAGPNGRIAEYLSRLPVDTLDLVISSHNHADHIGGVIPIFGSTVVRSYMDNGLRHDSDVYRRTIRVVQQSGVQYFQATTRRMTLGDAKLRILPPPANANTQNEASIGVVLEFGAFRALLTGDSEVNELQHWLANDSIPQVHVLKVAHHGADDGTSADWANATRPSIAVISVGGSNGYGHPTAGVLSTWAAVGAQVYRTDLHGTIVIEAKPDGTFTVSTTTIAER